MARAIAHNITVANRRNFMIVAGGLAAAIAGGLAFAAASPAACAVTDPILAAIAAHQEAARAVDAMILTRQLSRKIEDDVELEPALTAAEMKAAEAVVTTAPTTMAGLRALRGHLSDVGRYTCCWAFVPNFLAPGAVEAFVARRAAAL